jgi:hypothetical protein
LAADDGDCLPGDRQSSLAGKAIFVRLLPLLLRLP